MEAERSSWREEKAALDVNSANSSDVRTATMCERTRDFVHGSSSFGFSYNLIMCKLLLQNVIFFLLELCPSATGAGTDAERRGAPLHSEALRVP